MYKSLQSLRNVNIGTLYPGHGPVTEDGNRAVAEAISMMEGTY
jgi:glyoxylase-like metal-dependent hydrolase (beta-lactamase superfamily II)